MSLDFPWQEDLQRLPHKYQSLIFLDDSLPQLGKFLDVVFTALSDQIQLLENDLNVKNLEIIIDAIFPSKIAVLINKNGRRFITASKTKNSNATISIESISSKIIASEDCLRFICGTLDFISEHIIDSCSKLNKQIDSQLLIACLVNDKEIQTAWARCAMLKKEKEKGNLSLLTKHPNRFTSNVSSKEAESFRKHKGPTEIDTSGNEGSETEYYLWYIVILVSLFVLFVLNNMNSS